MFRFNLPDPGEGLVEAEIVNWLVAEGDEVRINDILVEIETAKSLVELPSPVSGTIGRLLAPVGQTVAVGSPIIEIDDGSPGEPLPAPVVPQAAEPEEAPPANLVGSGPIPEPATRCRNPSPVAAPVTAPAPVQRPTTTPVGKVLAKPLVRRLARDLGVALQSIRPTGPGGSVSRADVEAAAGMNRVDDGARVPIRGVRKATAEAVAGSVGKHVHVTEFNTLDVSATMALVATLKQRREFRDLHVSPLLLHAKAVCLAMARQPDLNASWDARAGEIVHHDHVNLGIAAATPRGLLVPVIREAETLSLVELCRAINEIVAVAKAGKLQPADYSGGTFSITNVGVFGIDSGTPIINGDESGILAMGAIKRRPWVVGTGDDERIEPRWVTTLALSFDHQLIDGEGGSRFLADISEILASPELALLY
ncbi:dihydrolipoamide acetyltransferase family protein [Brooklawnia cerclae]|uniref:Dihydrolipoamide acetyltransferase component of pyruvate dehydrogenase complex n=1 Tax=Brooklawnia cerclae TaxID=349934 RepID=A0ABX0SJL3_9ACTN|nr:pyruvate dehydrogenase E2 component (dihydrolipoamide acetyltransferase) [Brooklawnia cerclae]